MSDYEIVDDLPPSRRAPSGAWAIARDNPGKWVRTGLSRNVHNHRKNHQGFEIVQRQGVIYVRWPAPATNGRKRR